MEYLRAAASSRHPPEKLLRKFLKSFPEKLLKPEESLFLMMFANTIPRTLQKCNLTSMFSYKF